MDIGRLKKVPLRELWKHEARSFSLWLAENLDLLNEVVALNLTLLQREAPAGLFSVDILAEDQNGNVVVIENQLEQTNHDHLGKLITYMSNLDAKIAIWISSNPRPEHEKAVHWLNETLPADTAFYLVKVEAYQIGGSVPAPLFSIVAGPSPESKEIGEKKKELAERHVLRLEFWKELLAKAKVKIHLHDKVSPSTDNWCSAGAGKSGLAYSYVIRMEDAQVEFTIDRGDQQENKRLFTKLFEKKNEIESTFGAPLDWHQLEDRRVCKIQYVMEGYGLEDKEHWESLQEKMIDSMDRLYKSIQPYISNL